MFSSTDEKHKKEFLSGRSNLKEKKHHKENINMLLGTRQ